MEQPKEKGSQALLKNEKPNNSSKKSNNNTHSSKSKTTEKTSCYEFDDEDSLEIDDSKLRSAIREAEGLRPIVSSKKPLKKTVNTLKSNKQQTLPNKKLNQVSSDEDTSTSTEKLDNIKSNSHTKSIRATNKTHLKLIKRRKTSSSLSFSSSSSSLIPLRKKLSLPTRKKINDTDEDEYEDCLSNVEGDDSINTDFSKNSHQKNTNTKKNMKEKKSTETNKPNENEPIELLNGNTEIEPAKGSFNEYRSKDAVKEEDYDEANSSFEDASTMITMLSNYDDVFVTEITSGVVTVTIKECISKDDFFKKRESDKTKMVSPIN